MTKIPTLGSQLTMFKRRKADLRHYLAFAVKTFSIAGPHSIVVTECDDGHALLQGRHRAPAGKSTDLFRSFSFKLFPTFRVLCPHLLYFIVSPANFSGTSEKFANIIDPDAPSFLPPFFIYHRFHLPIGKLSWLPNRNFRIFWPKLNGALINKHCSRYETNMSRWILFRTP